MAKRAPVSRTATDLQQVLRFFDPRKPLSDPADLQQRGGKPNGPAFSFWQASWERLG